MDSRQCAAVQRLITGLDDTRLLYARLEVLLIRPHLRFLIARMQRSHAVVADDLVRQMDLTGGLTARRGGGPLARLRARIEAWIATAHVDPELGCLKCVTRRETAVVARFADAMANVKDLHPNLQRELRELERTLFRIESLTREMHAPPPATPRRPAAVATVRSNRNKARS